MSRVTDVAACDDARRSGFWTAVDQIPDNQEKPWASGREPNSAEMHSPLKCHIPQPSGLLR